MILKIIAVILMILSTFECSSQAGDWIAKQQKFLDTVHSSASLKQRSLGSHSVNMGKLHSETTYTLKKEFIFVNVATAVCDISSNTNIGTIYDEWNCSNITQVCNWRGITCDGPNNIIIITLNSLSGLTGTIPSSIGYLDSLSYLGLAYTDMSGAIPTTIGYLSSLLYLNLKSSKFQSNIPSTIQSMSNLLYLDLSYNQFSSFIPTTIGYLTNLEQLYLSNNKFSSSIPTSIGKLQKLISIGLHSNHFSSIIPNSITELHQLKWLLLQENSFSSTIPNSIGALTNLDTLFFQRNKLTGSIPLSIGNCTKLSLLFLYDNQLSSRIPSTIGYLQQLSLLFVSQNQLTGPVPTTIGFLSAMYALDFGVNKLTSSLPTSLGNLLQLVYLDIHSNRFSSQIPLTFSGLVSIEFILIYDNQFIGMFPQQYCTHDAILALANNRFDCSPWCQDDANWNNDDTSFKRCPDDQDKGLYDIETAFDVSHYLENNLESKSEILQSSYPFNEKSSKTLINRPNAVSYAISMSAITSLCRSKLRFCLDINCTSTSSILGEFQGLDWIGRTSSTYTLTINGPSFYFIVEAHPDEDAAECNNIVPGYKFTLTTYSQAPFGWTFNTSSTKQPYAQDLCQKNWGGVTCVKGSIREISFPAYAFYGEIPSTISNIFGLTKLDLSGNVLGGSIPTSLGTLYELNTLKLSMNNLHGEIPTTIVFLSALMYVDFSYNAFSGSIPTIFGNMSTLKSLTLDSNAFSGEAPSELCPLAKDYGTTVSMTRNRLTCYQEACWEAYLDGIRTEYYASETWTIFDHELTACHPTTSPTTAPSPSPSVIPTIQPSPTPTVIPTDLPTSQPVTPSAYPTEKPTPTSVPSSTPTVTPTIKVVVVQPLLSKPQTIAISVCCSTFGCFLIAYILYRSVFSKEAHEKRRRYGRLKHLPIHRMLLEEKSNMNVMLLLELVEVNMATANEKDFDGNTALKLILNGKTKRQISSDIVYRLLLNCLPFNRETGQKLDEEEHGHGWVHAVQVDDDVTVEAVGRILEEFRPHIDFLANATDASGRKAKDIAGPRCKRAIYRKLYLFERYEIKEGPPEHRSATSLVIFAIDHSGENVDNPSRAVALKFMKFHDQFIKEVKMREQGEFESRYVLPIIANFDTKRDIADDMTFRRDAIMKGYLDYPYCIVMEAASQSLKRIIDHEHIAGMEWDAVKQMMRHLTSALQHVHDKGIVHGDLKPLNVLMVGSILKLTDLDASANYRVHEFAGTKYSSGYIPPELLCADRDDIVVVRSSNGQTEQTLEQSLDYSLVYSDPAQDMWALGCVLYLLCTGSTLFHVTTEDNIVSQQDMAQLLEWNNEIKERKLRIVKDKLAKNLLSLLLSKDPLRRPVASRVLTHPFLTGVQATRLQGDAAKWDVFLSYRVESDSDHVEKLYSCLIKKGLRVWWDKKCLLPGQNWEEGFCTGLIGSATFVCLASRNAIYNPNKDVHNCEKLQKNSRCDNLLLEWRLALELKEREMIDGIFPVMIGDKDGLGFYSSYFRTNCHPTAIPNVAVDSIEIKVREHLEREGLGMPYKDQVTVRHIVDEIIKNQGGKIEGEMGVSLAHVAESVFNMVKNSKKSSVKKTYFNRQSSIPDVIQVNSRHIRQSLSDRSVLDPHMSHKIVAQEYESLIKIQEEDISLLNSKLNSVFTDWEDLKVEYAVMRQENADLLDLVHRLHSQLEERSKGGGEPEIVVKLPT